VKLSPQLPDDLQTIVINMDDSSRLADYIATTCRTLPSFPSSSSSSVLRFVTDWISCTHELAKELEVLELRSKIQNQVQEEVGKSQREYFLREQLRAIQRELGESDDTQREIEELRKKMESSGMPEEAQKEAERELGRLSRMSPAAPNTR
jgi:ATP-dependent Lon protease